MGSAMAQQALMIWDQIKVGWNQLKEKFVFQWFRVTDDNYKGPERIGAEMSRDGQSDGQPKAFRPDDRQKRSEFSLHIGS